MSTVIRGAVFAALILVSSADIASADPITYNLVGVTLTGGGTLTGSFVTNATDTTVVSWDIKASAKGAYPGFEYTTANSTLYTLLPSLIQFDTAGSAQELRLTFSPQLTASGASLSTNSYEYENVAGSRNVVAGKVVAAVPEPSPIILAGITGMLGGGGFWWRRKRAA